MSDLRKIKRALISVSDKSGVVDLARGLASHGVTIISTGGTASALREAGIEVTEVSEITGFPEMMDGRVKTLHPMVHGAFLALRDNDDHVASMKQHGIDPIDLVVVNLYPFESTIAKEGVSLPEAVEQIDIGGPAMIRSASKNWRDVAVVTDPRLYPEILAELNENSGELGMETRQRLAALAYTRTAAYDLAISSFLAHQLSAEDLERLEPLNPLGHLSFIDHDISEAPDAEGDTLLGGILVGVIAAARADGAGAQQPGYRDQDRHLGLGIEPAMCRTLEQQHVTTDDPDMYAVAGRYGAAPPSLDWRTRVSGDVGLPIHQLQGTTPYRSASLASTSHPNNPPNPVRILSHVWQTVVRQRRSTGPARGS